MNVGVMFLIVFFGALLFGIPIAYALGLATTIVVMVSGIVPMDLIIQTFFTSGDTFPLLAVPFFILAGDIMLHGGISERLVGFGRVMLGHVNGALGLITVFTCLLFAAISGSGPATTAAIGGIMIPAMIKEGYDDGYATSLTAAAGALGPVIPPSITFIMYGIIASVSITDLFIAGILPGIVIAITLSIFVYFTAKKNNFGEKHEKATGKEKLIAFKDAAWSLMVPIIILGGIYGGFVTPTEAAILACNYGILVGLFVYKELKFKDLPRIFASSALTAGTVLVLVGCATAFGKVLTLARIPQLVSEAILGFSSNIYVVLTLINLLLLLTGMFMETLASVIILAPLLLAIVEPLGVSSLHFGVIMICNLVIGQCTPPVGVNMFVAAGIGNIKVEKMFRWLFPFILMMIVSLAVITFVPALSTFLPNLMKN